jgi:hypothetical protein
MSCTSSPATCKSKNVAVHLAPSSFKVLGDNTNLSNAWEQYFKRFEYYLKATGATKDEQQRVLLLRRI